MLFFSSVSELHPKLEDFICISLTPAYHNAHDQCKVKAQVIFCHYKTQVVKFLWLVSFPQCLQHPVTFTVTVSTSV